MGTNGTTQPEYDVLLIGLVLPPCPALCKYAGLCCRHQGLTVSAQSYSLFLPTIIKALGYTATTAQLFTVPPNIAAFLLVLISAGFSDRLRARGPFMLGGCLLAIIGYVMLIVAKRPAVSYGGTFFVAAGVFPGKQEPVSSW